LLEVLRLEEQSLRPDNAIVGRHGLIRSNETTPAMPPNLYRTGRLVHLQLSPPGA
jgi:hypothetical protein